MYISSAFCFKNRCRHGRRLRGDCGDGPPKFEEEGRSMHPSLNILRTTVIGCKAKYELMKIEVFGQEKGEYTGDTGKMQSMTKKRSSEILGREKEIFS